MKVNYRQEFDLLKKELATQNKQNARVTFSSLILSVPINANSNSYNFPILENDAPGVAQIPDEIRLNQNDMFSMYEAGIYLRALLVNNQEPTPAQVSYFLTASPSELDSDYLAYERLYEGTFEWSVNNIKWLENWDTRRHLYKGITQWKNAAVGSAYATFPSNNFDENGMSPFIPKLNISGAKKNTPSIILPEAITPLPAATGLLTPNGDGFSLAITHIVLRLKGFLCQNCADFQTQESAKKQSMQRDPDKKFKFGRK